MVKIHGKKYMTVAERLDLITKEHKNYELTSEVINLTESACCIRATLKLGERIFTGIAHEEKSTNNINKTSYVECCETSAWGRAMAAAGYAGTEIASAEEIANAVIKQASLTPQKETPKPDANKLQIGKDKIHALLKDYSVEDKKAIIKKATFSHYNGKDSWVDDVNNLTKNGYEPTEKQLFFYYKKIQEELLNMADKPGSDVNQVGEILQEVMP